MIDLFLNSLKKLSIIDLSHTLEEGIPFFPTHTKFRHVEIFHPKDPAKMFSLEIHEHSGTHIDAPLHYLPPGVKYVSNLHDASSLPLEKMIGSGVVVEIEPNSENLVTAGKIIKWEKINNCDLEDFDFILFFFGWDKYWSTNPEISKNYTNNWPGLSKDCSEYLLTKNIIGVGTDCIGLDKFGSIDIPAHHTLLQKKIFIFENLNNLSTLGNATPFVFIAFPLKILKGSGSPIRAVALTEKRKGQRTIV